MFDCNVSQYQLRKMRHLLLVLGPALARDNPEALRLVEEIRDDARNEDEARAPGRLPGERAVTRRRLPELSAPGSDAEDRADLTVGFGWDPETVGLNTNPEAENSLSAHQDEEPRMKRDHGHYWVIVNDAPAPRDGVSPERVAEWAYLGAAGHEVWFLPGDEDYRFDKEVTVVSGRLPEPGASVLSRLRDRLGLRDGRRNYRLY